MIEIGKRPPRHRGAFVSFDVPAAALVTGGSVYAPPASGAVISGASMHVEGSSEWRLGVIDDATFGAATFGDIGGIQAFPLWPGPNYTITGTVRAGQFFAIGDRMIMAQGQPYENSVLVMPGNIFFMSATTANLVAEGGYFVHEFLNPDEFERWNGSRDA